MEFNTYVVNKRGEGVGITYHTHLVMWQMVGINVNVQNIPLEGVGGQNSSPWVCNSMLEVILDTSLGVKPKTTTVWKIIPQEVRNHLCWNDCKDKRRWRGGPKMLIFVHVQLELKISDFFFTTHDLFGTTHYNIHI